MLPLISPALRPEPFDHADWVFEVKFDGFRAAADTVRPDDFAQRQPDAAFRKGVCSLAEGPLLTLKHEMNDRAP
jgi:hypothetical protein